MSQIASAQPASSRSVSSGRAEVVKSRSLCSRPSIASRTGPPTSASSLAGGAEPGAELVDDRRDPAAPDGAGCTRRQRGRSGRRTTERAAVPRSDPAGRSPCRCPRACIAVARRCAPSRRRGRCCLAAPRDAAARRPRAPASGRGEPRDAPRLAAAGQRSTRCPVDHPDLRPRSTLTGRSPTGRRRPGPTSRRYLFTSAEPITDAGELAEAAAPPSTRRRRAAHRPTACTTTSATSPRAQTTSYRVSVPRRSLGISGQPGVYWIGVHVLGSDPDGVATRSPTAGPARSSRCVPAAAPPPDPARAGRAGQERRCAAAPPAGCSASARLAAVAGPRRPPRPAAEPQRPGRRPLTWVVDPAVLDAVASVAQDNPKLDPGPTRHRRPARRRRAPTPSPVGERRARPTARPPATAPTPATRARPPSRPPRRSPPAPGSRSSAGRRRPHGRDGALRRPRRRRRARQPARATSTARPPSLSAETMTAYGDRAAAPRSSTPLSGCLAARRAARPSTPSTPVLLGDARVPAGARGTVLTRDGQRARRAHRHGGRSRRPAARTRATPRSRCASGCSARPRCTRSPRTADQPLVVVHAAVLGPRQRLGARGLLRRPRPALAADGRPALGGVRPRPRRPTPPGRPPVYPPRRPAAAAAAREPAGHRAPRRAPGTTFGRLLADNDTVEGDARPDRDARLVAERPRRRRPGPRQVERAPPTTSARRCSQVRIEGPPFVMMSGETGPIQVTLVNDLDQPVHRRASPPRPAAPA